MNFEPTEQQRLLAESARRLATGPLSFDKRRHFFVPGAAIEEDWAAIANLGVPGLLVAEAQGGLGAGFHDMAAVLEAFGRGLVVEPVIPTAVAAASVLSSLGRPAQQARWLQPLAAGTLRAALAWTEKQSRYRLDKVATTARRNGDGFVLGGEKSLVLGGDSADLLIVPARLADDPAGGLALFLVPAGTPGLAVTPYRLLDLRGAADLTLTGVVLPADALLAGDAAAALERAVDRVTAALCFEAVGAMSVLHELALEQLRTRTVFGRKLGHFQVPQHRLVDMIVACELARSLAMLAADAADRTDGAERAQAISAAKVQVGRSARLIGEQAVQLHGAMGITLEHASGAYHKKLTVIDHLCGDIEHHLERFAASSGY